jgi:flagellar hook-associated protein 1 FlgK
MPIYDGTGMIGTGAEITSVERVRDEYLDFKYWTEQISFGEWVSKNEVLSDIEATFNEPSDSGFSSIISDFFFSLQELSKDPGSPAVRALVRQRGISMTKYFNATAARFQKLQSDVNYKIKQKQRK